MNPDPSERDAVAVILPVHNGEKYLREALDSVLRQTRSPAEIIIIDDGSSDGSAQVARAYAAAHPTVKLIQQPNSGVATARNRAAEAATAPLLAFLDHDDLWQPTKLARQIEALRQSPEAAVCICATEILSHAPGSDAMELVSGITLPAPGQIGPQLHRTLRFQPSAVIMRRETFLTAGGFAPTHFCEDWDLWLRLDHQGVRFAVVPEPLTIYRSHATNTSNNAWKMYHAEILTFELHIASRTPALLRPFVRQRMKAHFLAGVALVEREQRRPHLLILLRSLAIWPFAEPRRYKIALHMILTRLGAVR